MSVNRISTVWLSATRYIFVPVWLEINYTFILLQAYVKFPYPYFYKILTENILQRKPAVSKISPYKSIGIIVPFPLILNF